MSKKPNDETFSLLCFITFTAEQTLKGLPFEALALFVKTFTETERRAVFK